MNTEILHKISELWWVITWAFITGIYIGMSISDALKPSDKN